MRKYNLNAVEEAEHVPAAEVRKDVAAPEAGDRQSLEIAFLKARIQHLELVLETARSLMGANHERLLRRLHEVPRELVELSQRLRRSDLQAATW